MARPARIHKPLEEFDNLVRELFKGTEFDKKRASARAKPKRRIRVKPVAVDPKVDVSAKTVRTGSVTERLPLPFAMISFVIKNGEPIVDGAALKEFLRSMFGEMAADRVEQLQRFFTPAQIAKMREIWKQLEPDT